jgi:hypothetical protein
VEGEKARDQCRCIEFEEIFELAEPGKPFEVYSHARFKPMR